MGPRGECCLFYLLLLPFLRLINFNFFVVLPLLNWDFFFFRFLHSTPHSLFLYLLGTWVQFCVCVCTGFLIWRFCTSWAQNWFDSLCRRSLIHRTKIKETLIEKVFLYFIHIASLSVSLRYAYENAYLRSNRVGIMYFQLEFQKADRKKLANMILCRKVFRLLLLLLFFLSLSLFSLKQKLPNCNKYNIELMFYEEKKKKPFQSKFVIKYTHTKWWFINVCNAVQVMRICMSKLLRTNM